MKEEDIIIRPATRSDADFIALTVLQSIEKDPELEPEVFNCLRNLCIFDETLYSYNFATICEVSGIVVGAIVAYFGDKYEERRKTTFDFIQSKTGLDLTPNVLETGPGEYYLDSLYVDPDYRGFKIGEKLIQHKVEHCFSELTPTLLVDKKAPGLQKYYSRCGFRPITGEIENFGKTYIKMKYEED